MSKSQLLNNIISSTITDITDQSINQSIIIHAPDFVCAGMHPPHQQTAEHYTAVITSFYHDYYYYYLLLSALLLL